MALGGEVGADTVRRLHVASGGNPLLLRELVLQSLAADRLRDDSGTWRIVGAIPPSQRLSELFAVRLGALGEPERHVLQQLALCAPMGPAELTGPGASAGFQRHVGSLSARVRPSDAGRGPDIRKKCAEVDVFFGREDCGFRQ